MAEANLSLGITFLYTTPITLTRVEIQHGPPLECVAVLSVLIGLNFADMFRGAHCRARITGTPDGMRTFLGARGWQGGNCSLKFGSSVKVPASSVKVLTMPRIVIIFPNSLSLLKLEPIRCQSLDDTS